YSALGTGKQHTEQDVDPWKRHPPRLAPEPGGPVAKMWDLYNRAKRTPDQNERDHLLWQIIKIHISDGPFFMGTIADYPQPVIHHNDLRNVPTRDNLAQHGVVNTWDLPCPAVYDPEAYFWSNPEQHA
ncbi:MAG TPA: hypothetical protein VHC49_13210, partial [Mycobacteriales bacterium]|nr:hypothetical protein [Mycobacteriales bacterium]